MSEGDYPQRRAQELLQRMTITEKALQVCSVVPMGVLGAGEAVASGLPAAFSDGIRPVAASARSAIVLRSSRPGQTRSGNERVCRGPCVQGIEHCLLRIVNRV